jgi:hypothetical protein
MAKEITREGSQARAEDRGRPQGLEFFEQPEADGGYLGDPDVVDVLVRQFLGEVHGVRLAWSMGTEENPTEAVAALVKRYAGIFMGSDPDYQAMPWNSPGQLGQHLIERIPLDVPQEEAASTFFMDLANQVLEAAESYASGEIGDEDAKFRIDVMADEATHALMGLRITAE